MLFLRLQRKLFRLMSQPIRARLESTATAIAVVPATCRVCGGHQKYTRRGQQHGQPGERGIALPHRYAAPLRCRAGRWEEHFEGIPRGNDGGLYRCRLVGWQGFNCRVACSPLIQRGSRHWISWVLVHSLSQTPDTLQANHKTCLILQKVYSTSDN